ncbi:hypothetical protein ACFFQW_24180 [Umezawaea endophytica]|uniref:Uncharacterized protein n=1 Tax=Umezawaea endophytica TaxID=1654476 RepID=A0A9X2VTX2_9PSEU|nr:hypothetical protein [Umezawaea endophytica]MCS7482122.1 hypothetical protein [Umezawaea endophytica]
MDWQENLRQLDARLAGGHMTRAEYVKERDQMLVRAAAPISGPPVLAPVTPQVAVVAETRPPPVERKPRKRRGIAVVAVLLVAALAGSTWWFTRDSGASNTAVASSGSTVPALPGAGQTENEMDVVRALDLKLLSPQEAGLLNDNGVNRFHFATSNDNTTSYALIVVDAGSKQEAAQISSGLTGQLRSAGFVDVSDGRFVLSGQDKAVLRVVYTSGDKVIRVGVAQGANPDMARLSQDLVDVLATVQAALPRG